MKVAISSRWTPAHYVFIDTAAGRYFEVNPPLHGQAEVDMQRLLLTPTKADQAEISKQRGSKS